MIRLANMPRPHVITLAHSVLDMFRINSAPENMQCAAPALEVIHRQGAALKTQGSFIAPADWDDLFVAVQTRLENCVSDTLNHTPVVPLENQKLQVQKVERECVEALQLLHHSLILERQSQQRP